MRVYILEKRLKRYRNELIQTTKFKTILNEVKRMISAGQKFFLYELKIDKNKSISFTRIRETLESGELEFEPISYGAVKDFDDPEFFLEIDKKTKRVFKRENLQNTNRENMVFKVKLNGRIMIFPKEN